MDRLVRLLVAHPAVRMLRPGKPDAEGRCVLYWMHRAQRGVGQSCAQFGDRAWNMSYDGACKKFSARDYIVRVEALENGEGDVPYSLRP